MHSKSSYAYSKWMKSQANHSIAMVRTTEQSEGAHW